MEEEIKKEIRILNLLYQIIKDKSVQRRFETAITVDMTTGEISNIRVIDECEKYVVNKINLLATALENAKLSDELLKGFKEDG